MNLFCSQIASWGVVDAVIPGEEKGEGGLVVGFGPAAWGGEALRQDFHGRLRRPVAFQTRGASAMRSTARSGTSSGLSTGDGAAVLPYPPERQSRQHFTDDFAAVPEHSIPHLPSLPRQDSLVDSGA